jgi:demethylmenaquinone methyltransferase/2-methoxy-6-polyprenyl-1,4-benzoquinol methylase/phosphoethanolamine N-methyltransferase
MFLGRVSTLRKLSLDLAALRPGERVLDVGCGSGDLALAAARKVGAGGTVWGIDAAPEMVEVARGKARRRRLAAQFQVAVVEALPFPDASFDVVLSSLMMHHLPGELRRRALAEIRRVLRPGGRMLIVDLDAGGRLPRPWEPGWLITRRHKLHKQHPHSTAGVRARGAALGDLLRDAGFEGVESGPTRYSWIGYTRGHLPEELAHGAVPKTGPYPQALVRHSRSKGARTQSRTLSIGVRLTHGGRSSHFMH